MDPQQVRWTAVDHYYNALFVPREEALEAALKANEAAGLPAHNVAPNQGKLLYLLAQVQQARQVLEIGTLGGYSTIWLARALPAGGRVVSLEVNAARAELARANVTRAGLAERVQIRTGRAVDSLAALVAEQPAPFDLIFIDADKPSNPDYLAWALQLARKGTLLIADNVVRNGAVADPTSQDANVLGVRRFNELVAAEPRLSATMLQTVGEKGYDGFTLALVVA